MKLRIYCPVFRKKVGVECSTSMETSRLLGINWCSAHLPHDSIECGEECVNLHNCQLESAHADHYSLSPSHSAG